MIIGSDFWAVTFTFTNVLLMITLTFVIGSSEMVTYYKYELYKYNLMINSLINHKIQLGLLLRVTVLVKISYHNGYLESLSASFRNAS